MSMLDEWLSHGHDEHERVDEDEPRWFVSKDQHEESQAIHTHRCHGRLRLPSVRLLRALVWPDLRCTHAYAGRRYCNSQHRLPHSPHGLTSVFTQRVINAGFVNPVILSFQSYGGTTVETQHIYETCSKHTL